MKRPFDGEPLSFKDFSKGTLRVHLTEVIGGIIWKEFKGASKSVNTLIFFMFIAYLAGLALLVYAGT